MKTEKEIEDMLNDEPDKGADSWWWEGFTDALEWVLEKKK